MKKFSVLLFVLVSLGYTSIAFSKEIPFTVEDRDILVRVESKLGEMEKRFKEGFEQIDKRFEHVFKAKLNNYTYFYG